MITRRSAIAGGLSLCLCSPSHAAGDDGCWVDAKVGQALIAKAPQIYSFSGTDPAIIPASGNELLDRALTRALLRLSRDFDVLPGFGYYNGNTALATSAVRMSRSDGTVLFGLPFMQRLLARPEHPDACVVAVCAHEFAHILQFKTGIDKKLTAGEKNVRNLELHADFLSGWFAGLRKLNNPDYPAVVFAALARDSGEQLSDHPGFHGTPEERGTAVEQGFLAGARDKLTLAQAINAGMKHVGSFRSAPVVDFKR